MLASMYRPGLSPVPTATPPAVVFWLLLVLLIGVSLLAWRDTIKEWRDIRRGKRSERRRH